jgi:hypothetical protein
MTPEESDKYYRPPVDPKRFAEMQELLAAMSPPPPMIAGIPVAPPDEPTVPWVMTDHDRALLYKLRLSGD